MTNTVGVLLRYSGVAVLWLAIGLLTIPASVGVLFAWATLPAIERLKELADDLIAWGLK